MICSLVPEIFFVELYIRALLKTPDTPLEKFESEDISPEIEERRNDTFARNLINRPYGTGRVFLLFPGTSCQAAFAATRLSSPKSFGA